MKGVIKDAFGLFDDAVIHYGIEGCVVVVDVEEGVELPVENEAMVLLSDGNWAFSSVVRDVRRLSPTAVGFFVPKLRPEEATLGSVVMWHEPGVERLVSLVKQTA